MFFGLDKFAANNLKELTTVSFYQALLAELIGTGILVAVGCGTCMNSQWEEMDGIHVKIAFAFGLTVATVARGIGHISGCHINPAVSISMFITRRITLLRLISYVSVQMVGGIFGAFILQGVTHNVRERSICPTTLGAYVRQIDGVVIEALITFILLFTILASTDPNRSNPGGSTPLAIGIVIVISHFFAIPYTGSSLNPARSFASAVVGGVWTDHWIYWVGPIVGGIVASLIYDFFLATNANIHKFSEYLFDSDYKADEFHGDVKVAPSIENTNI